MDFAVSCTHHVCVVVVAGAVVFMSITNPGDNRQSKHPLTHRERRRLGSIVNRRQLREGRKEGERGKKEEKGKHL